MAKRRKTNDAAVDLVLEEEEIPPTDPRPVRLRKGKKANGKVNGALVVEAADLRKVKPADVAPGTRLVLNGVDVLGEMELGVKFADLAHRTGVKRGKLKRMIAAALGGAEGYKKKRETLVRTRDAEPVKLSTLDKGVPRLPGAPLAEGWRLSRIFVDYGGKRLNDVEEHDPRMVESLLTSPEGIAYVHAKPNERADLIIAGKKVEKYGLDPIRLRRFDTSSVYRLVRRHEELVKAGEEAEAARAEAKKQKDAIAKTGEIPMPTKPQKVKRKGGMRS